MEWLKNLNNAITYIEDNLDKTISYEEAARIACCSTYYFQRLFSYVTGISLADYIRRRKMTQAAFELQRTNKKVLDIAMTYGYTSPTSFNRAFQNIHGISPAAAKHIGCTLHLYPPIAFSVEVRGDEVMSYSIEEKEAMRVVGVRTRLYADMEENQKHVPCFWDQILQGDMFPKIKQLSTSNPKQILGISVYENVDNIFYYVAAQSNVDIPEGMYAYEIPAATWVVFKHDGQFKERVQHIFQRFYKEWLLFSGYEYAGFPDIEVYPIVDQKTMTSGDFEVWIAIRKVKEN